MKNIFIVLFAASVALVACKSGDKKARLETLRKQKSELEEQIAQLEKELGPDSTAGDKLRVVEFTPLTRKPFRHYVEVQGKLDSDNSINVTSKMPGQLMKINVKEGDRVVKGQVMFEQDSLVYVKGIQEAKNGLAFATQMYEKQKSLWDKKIGSEVQYLTAKNQKEALELRIATLQEQLAMTRIEAPISGVVDQVISKTGELLAPGWPIARIVNMSGFKVLVDVPENYAGKIRPGIDAIVSFPDLGKEFNTTVTHTGKIIDPMTRSFRVEIRIANNGEDLKPNMIANVKMADSNVTGGIVIPVNTLQKSENGEYVLVAEKSKTGEFVVKKRNIKTGASYGGMVVVESGLEEGDNLITFGYQGLSEGQQVKSSH